jgi:hypothetical protein
MSVRFAYNLSLLHCKSIKTESAYKRSTVSDEKSLDCISTVTYNKYVDQQGILVRLTHLRNSLQSAIPTDHSTIVEMLYFIAVYTRGRIHFKSHVSSGLVITRVGVCKRHGTRVSGSNLGQNRFHDIFKDGCCPLSVVSQRHGSHLNYSRKG